MLIKKERKEIEKVAVTIAGYIFKKLKKRSKCNLFKTKLTSKKLLTENNHYLNLLSRVGLSLSPGSISPHQDISCLFICKNAYIYIYIYIYIYVYYSKMCF